MSSWATIMVVMALVSVNVTPTLAGSGRRCGKVLLEFMEIVCEGVFYDPYENPSPKRNIMGQRLYPLVSARMDGRDKTPPTGFLRPESASELLGKRNLQEGIVFECCYKACSILEAQNYCPP